MRKFLILLGTIVTTLVFAVPVFSLAAETTPQKFVYTARLLSSAGAPLTSSYSIRFSYWKSADFSSSDLTGAGAIDTAATNYASWQEVHTVTPDSNGNFSVELGSVTALPSMDALAASTLLSLFLQVEVKASADPNTAYELLDPQPLDATVDRASVLSVPFALNADRLDQRDIGTGSGSIPLLGSGGLLPTSTIPGGTNAKTFTIDADNNSPDDITLKFGDSLSKSLSYDIGTGAFIFNDDVSIQGNLTITGLINGIDIDSIASSGTSPLRTTSGAGLQVNVAAGNYRINGTTVVFTGSTVTVANDTDSYLYFTGTGFTARTGGFPTGISFIPLSKVTASGGGIESIEDRRVLQSDDREREETLVLQPSFPDAAYDADGTNNVGQLAVTHDDSSDRNVYSWTSTRSTLQDYTIVIRTALPQTFSRWQQTPLSVRYKTSSGNSADAKVDIQVFDTAVQEVTLGGGSTNLASGTWATADLTWTGTPTWAANGSLLIKITVSAKESTEVQIGDVSLRTVTLGAD